MRASGSANTVNASSNATPCFFRFSRAFVASHSNSGVEGTVTDADAARSESPMPVGGRRLQPTSRTRTALRVERDFLVGEIVILTVRDKINKAAFR